MGIHENDYDPDKTNQAWCTPDVILEPIYKHFGTIGLDPCANPERLLRTNIDVFAPDAEIEGTVLRDGLAHSWNDCGLVYANPPYFDLAPWVHKASTEGDEVILLLPVRTSNNWWQSWVAPADVILFWKGRLWFAGANDPAPFHSALIYWGARPELFLEAFPGHWYVRNTGEL